MHKSRNKELSKYTSLAHSNTSYWNKQLYPSCLSGMTLVLFKQDT